MSIYSFFLGMLSRLRVSDLSLEPPNDLKETGHFLKHCLLVVCLALIIPRFTLF